MYSPGTVKSKNNVSYNVYIITPQKNYNSWNYTWYYKEDITNVYIMDYRNNKDPNMQILNSYIIDTKELKLEIIGLMQEYNNKVPSEREWKRSNDSMLVEWDFHNFAYNLGYKKDRTGDTDFNNNDEGKGFKDFVFR